MYNDGIPAAFSRSPKASKHHEAHAAQDHSKHTENQLTHDTPTQDPYLSSPHAPIASLNIPIGGLMLPVLNAFEGCIMHEPIGAVSWSLPG